MSLKKRETFSYGVGAIGKDLVYALVAGFLFKFYEDTLGINPVFVGTLLMAARIFDAFNDPFMGVIVDKTKTRFGKFRPWILIGTIINAIVLFFLFAVPENLSGTNLLIYVSVAYVLWGVTYTIMDIPYWSMIPALTSEPKDRENISVIGRSFAGLGFALATALTIPLVNLLGNGNQIIGFKYFGLIVAIFFVLTTLVTVFNVKEKVQPEQLNTPTVRQMFGALVKNDQALVVVLTIIIFNSSLYLTQNLALYFFKYDIGNENLFGTFGLIGGATQILAMTLLPALRKKFTRKQIFIGANFTAIIGYVVLFLLGTLNITNIVFLSLAAMIIFSGFGLCTVLTTIFLADTVDYGEWKTHQRNESVIFALQTFVVKFAAGISVFISGISIALINLDKKAEVQSYETLLGLRVAMIVVPIIGLFISILIFRSKYKLDDTFIGSMVSEMKDRKKIHN